MLHRIQYRIRLLLNLVVGLGVLIVSCSKSIELADDPYAGGKKVLDINFVSKSTDAAFVTAGSTLDLKVDGLMKYKDQFKLVVNEIEAEVLNFTDSTIKFVVPLTASTGSVWVTANGQSFFGPVIKIDGKVSVDDSFRAVNGASKLTIGGDASIYDAEVLPTGNIWLGGAFDNYEQKGSDKTPIGGIVQIDASGNYSTSGVKFGIGVVGGMKLITSINRINTGSKNGYYVIAGSFNAFNSKKENRLNINNITMLRSSGELDTLITKDIVNPKPSDVWKNKDTIPVFNGGVDGFVRKTFVFGEQIYVIGHFQNYKRMYVPNSTYDEKVYDNTRMLQLARLNMDGSMDSTFHFDKEKRQSPVAGNGGITDAVMQIDGKLVLVGNFTTFNGVTVNRIVRLNLDGSVDNTFLANTGVGANGDIYSIRYNRTTNKFVLAGNFTNFNGKASSNLTVLNADGSLDDNFVGSELTGGGATFAAQLNNGKIILTGNFSKYGAYVRQGFAILEQNGTLAVGYNNTGGFQGRVFDMIENESANESKVTLVGDIRRFNAMLPHNILRITIKK